MPFSKNDPNINRKGRPKDPAVQKYRDAIDGVITPKEWASYLKQILESDKIDDDKKLATLKTIAELRAPGLKLPTEIADDEDRDININIDL